MKVSVAFVLCTLHLLVSCSSSEEGGATGSIVRPPRGTLSGAEAQGVSPNEALVESGVREEILGPEVVATSPSGSIGDLPGNELKPAKRSEDPHDNCDEVERLQESISKDFEVVRKEFKFLTAKFKELVEAYKAPRAGCFSDGSDEEGRPDHTKVEPGALYDMELVELASDDDDDENNDTAALERDADKGLDDNEKAALRLLDMRFLAEYEAYLNQRLVLVKECTRLRIRGLSHNDTSEVRSLIRESRLSSVFDEITPRVLAFCRDAQAIIKYQMLSYDKDTLSYILEAQDAITHPAELLHRRGNMVNLMIECYMGSIELLDLNKRAIELVKAAEEYHGKFPSRFEEVESMILSNFVALLRAHTTCKEHSFRKHKSLAAQLLQESLDPRLSVVAEATINAYFTTPRVSAECLARLFPKANEDGEPFWVEFLHSATMDSIYEALVLQDFITIPLYVKYASGDELGIERVVNILKQVELLIRNNSIPGWNDFHHLGELIRDDLSKDQLSETCTKIADFIQLNEHLSAYDEYLGDFWGLSQKLAQASIELSASDEAILDAFHSVLLKEALIWMSAVHAANHLDDQRLRVHFLWHLLGHDIPRMARISFLESRFPMIQWTDTNHPGSISLFEIGSSCKSSRKKRLTPTLH